MCDVYKKRRKIISLIGLRNCPISIKQLEFKKKLFTSGVKHVRFVGESVVKKIIVWLTLPIWPTKWLEKKKVLVDKEEEMCHHPLKLWHMYTWRVLIPNICIIFRSRDYLPLSKEFINMTKLYQYSIISISIKAVSFLSVSFTYLAVDFLQAMALRSPITVMSVAQKTTIKFTKEIRDRTTFSIMLKTVYLRYSSLVVRIIIFSPVATSSKMVILLFMM